MNDTAYPSDTQADMIKKTLAQTKLDDLAAVGSKPALKQLANAHRIVKVLDTLLDLLDDPNTFSKDHWIERNVLLEELVRARRAAANIQMSLGDGSAYNTMPKLRYTLERNP